MKTNFLQVCIGISIVLLTAGFFIHSIIPAAAQTNVGNTENTNIGKYDASICFGTEGKIFALIIDTESGKSVFYYIESDNGGSWTKRQQQLPANPF